MNVSVICGLGLLTQDPLKPRVGVFSVLIGCHTCPLLPAASPLGGFEQNEEGGLLIVHLPV